MRSPLIALIVVAACAVTAAADDWPQWRGVNRDGVSAETGLLRAWPEGGPRLVWVANTAGEGYGSVAIADGKVYVLGNGDKEQRHWEWLSCLDDRSGKQLWSCAMGRVRSRGGGYPGPRSTPTVSNGKVYVLGLAGRLLCCDAKTGQPLWFRELTRDFGGVEPHFGYSESVLVDGARVICMPGKEKTVVALDADTGEELWAAKLGDAASYSSIIKATLAETAQYVAFTEKGLVGLRARDGALLWRYDAPSNGQANVPTPVAIGDTVFAASGYGRGGGCAKIQHDDEGAFSARQLYFTNRMQNMHGGYVVLDGLLYGCCDPGVLVSMDYKTGAPKQAVRTGRFSIVAADGLLFVRGEKGRVDLYDTAAKKLASCGRFDQPHRSELKAWAHPAIANRRLYLRDQFYVLCYDIAAAAETKPAAGPVEK